jgi:hypothetical protein
MAKKKKKTGGPYLAAAFFCENVLESKDGLLTPIRILDQITLPIPADVPADFPSKENPAIVTMSGLLSFKTGYWRAGQHTVRTIMHSPSGKKPQAVENNLEFSRPPQGGANLILRSQIKVFNGGLFWFDVYLDGKLMTRMPLVITLQKQEPQPNQPAPPPSPNGSKKPRRNRRQ